MSDIIQQNQALAGDASEQKPAQLPPTTIHTLLTLAKLVQMIQSQLHEEKQDVPQVQSYPPTTVPMEAANTPATKAVGSSAGTAAEAVSGDPSANSTEGGGA